MNTQTIIKALNVPNAGSFAKHATKLSNIFKFINQIKPDIVSADIINRGKMFFGAETEVNYSRTDRDGNFITYERCKGTEFDCVTFELKTATGVYKFAIPDKTEVYNYACFLLGIDNDNTIAATTENADIVAPAELAKNIGKALKFTSKDNTRPEMQAVCLEFERGQVTAISTNAYILYYSKPLQFSGNYSGQILINKEVCSELVKIKNPGDISFYIAEDGKVKIVAGGRQFEVQNDYNRPYPNYKAVTPALEELQPMQVNKQLLTDAIKPILPIFGKHSAHQLNFHLNGSVNITALDVDYDHEATANLPYLTKAFETVDISFNGKDLVKVLDALCNTKNKYYATDNPDVITWHLPKSGPNRAVFTGNIPGEKVLLMGLYTGKNK